MHAKEFDKQLVNRYSYLILNVRNAKNTMCQIRTPPIEIIYNCLRLICLQLQIANKHRTSIVYIVGNIYSVVNVLYQCE